MFDSEWFRKGSERCACFSSQNKENLHLMISHLSRNTSLLKDSSMNKNKSNKILNSKTQLPPPFIKKYECLFSYSQQNMTLAANKRVFENHCLYLSGYLFIYLPTFKNEVMLSSLKLQINILRLLHFFKYILQTKPYVIFLGIPW